jgi:hypothetical protein
MRFLFLLWFHACWHVSQRWMFEVSRLHTRQGRWMGMSGLPEFRFEVDVVLIV